MSTKSLVRERTGYTPMMPLQFDKKTSRFHLYHSEGGESFCSTLTRLNILFIVGNGFLLMAEIVSPCK